MEEKKEHNMLLFHNFLCRSFFIFIIDNVEGNLNSLHLVLTELITLAELITFTEYVTFP